MTGTTLVICFVILNILYVIYQLRDSVREKVNEGSRPKGFDIIEEPDREEYIKQQKIQAELAYRDFTNSVDSYASDEELVTKAIKAIRQLDWIRDFEESVDALCLFIYIDLAERDVPLLKKVITELGKDELPIIMDVMHSKLMRH